MQSNSTSKAKEIRKRLVSPFRYKDLDWRFQELKFKRNQYESYKQNGKVLHGMVKSKLLVYVDARAVQNRLDEVFGVSGWKTEFKPYPCVGQKAVMCALSVKSGEAWITKEDGAPLTNIEAEKGGLSDAFKRAAVQFGIGRYLYNFEHYECVLPKTKQCRNDYPFYSPIKADGGVAHMWYNIPSMSSIPSQYLHEEDIKILQGAKRS